MWCCSPHSSHLRISHLNTSIPGTVVAVRGDCTVSIFHAGKSTVREIIGSHNFWSSVASEAIVIEADAIKNQDVIMQELKTCPAFANDSALSQCIHEYSTRHASGMLVAAVNAQKDIIFDGGPRCRSAQQLPTCVCRRSTACRRHRVWRSHPRRPTDESSRLGTA